LSTARTQIITGVSSVIPTLSETGFIRDFPDKGYFLVTEEDISAHLPQWPAYKRDGGEIIVFQANSTHVETDDFRKEGMEFWMRTWDHTMMLTRGMAGYN